MRERLSRLSSGFGRYPEREPRKGLKKGILGAHDGPCPKIFLFGS
jgi:hypothetical protein